MRALVELDYGMHAPLGRTLDVPEERDAGGYVGAHRPEALGGCPLGPDECEFRCRVCAQHMCICPEDEPLGSRQFRRSW